MNLEIPPSNKWQEIQEREMEEQKLKEMQEIDIRDRIDKRLQYAKEVKKEHWPTISIKKRQEIEKRKMNVTRNSSKPLTSRVSNSMISSSMKEDPNTDEGKPHTPLKKVNINGITTFIAAKVQS